MKTIEITATEDDLSNPANRWAGNRHRIVLKEESVNAFVGWADPNDRRNSPHHKPGIDLPTTYPKCAWKEVQS